MVTLEVVYLDGSRATERWTGSTDAACLLAQRIARQPDVVDVFVMRDVAHYLHRKERAE